MRTVNQIMDEYHQLRTTAEHFTDDGETNAADLAQILADILLMVMSSHTNLMSAAEVLELATDRIVASSGGDQ